MKVTKHAKKRIKERAGVPKSAANNLARLALERGYRHSDFKGKFLRYLDGIFLAERKANNMRVFNRKVFVFRNEVLITIISVPRRFKNVSDYIKKEVDKMDKRDFYLVVSERDVIGHMCDSLEEAEEIVKTKPLFRDQNCIIKVFRNLHPERYKLFKLYHEHGRELTQGIWNLLKFFDNNFGEDEDKESRLKFNKSNI